MMNFARGKGIKTCVLGGATPANSAMTDGALVCDLRGMTMSQKTACVWYIPST